jgi:hypothetical protein
MWWWWKVGRGGKFPKQNKPGTLPCKGGEVGACKDLEGTAFTIRSGNNGKDGDMLNTSREKLVLYIGTNNGDDAFQVWFSEKQLVLHDAFQEWLSEKQLVLQEPTYPDAVQVAT